jgi:general secretion pathway protein F
VVPQIVGVLTSMKQDLPLPTTVLIGLSELVKRWGIVFFVGLVAVLFAVRFALRRDAVRMVWHRWLLRLPLIGKLTRASNTARAARTLALLSASAVPLLDALAISAQVVPNLPMREALRRAAHKVREGGAFSRALADSGYFPPVAVRLIASGERSGQLERMLDEAAAHQARELDRWLAVLTAVLGPAVILLVGAMVLFIVLAILLPIFNLNQMVK